MRKHHVALIITVSLLLGALRLAGARDEAFQAIAHVWVGGLFGARIAAGDLACGRIAFALSLLEVVAFLVGAAK